MDRAAMTARLVVALVCGVVAMTLIAGAVVLWPRRDASLRVVDDRLVGEATGYVSSVGADDETLRVSTSVFDVRPITVHVSRDTTIVVGDKQGVLDDVIPGMSVRVGYQMEGDRRVAKVIEVGTGDRGAAGTPPLASRPPDSADVERDEEEAMDAPAVGAEPGIAASQDSESATIPEAPPAPEPVDVSPAPPSETRQADAPPALPPRSTARTPSMSAHAPVSPAPRRTLPARESVLDLSASVHKWVEAAKRRDVPAQLSLYAESMDSFYGRYGFSKEDVRAEKLRAFGSGEALLDTGSPEIRLEPSGRVASVTFVKRFVLDGDRAGTAVQELRWARTDAGWRIVAESDAPVSSRQRSN